MKVSEMGMRKSGAAAMGVSEMGMRKSGAAAMGVNEMGMMLVVVHVTMKR